MRNSMKFCWILFTEQVVDLSQLNEWRVNQYSVFSWQLCFVKDDEIEQEKNSIEKGACQTIGLVYLIQLMMKAFWSK